MSPLNLKQGDRAPWIFSQDYFRERDEIPHADLDDGTLVYGPQTGTSVAA